MFRALAIRALDAARIAPLASFGRLAWCALLANCALPAYETIEASGGGVGGTGARGGAGGAGVGGAGAGGAGGSLPKCVSAAGGSANYEQLIVADGARSYWRLGETSGPTAIDRIGEAPGTYMGLPSFGETGALANDPDGAVGFPAGAGNFVQVEDIYDFPDDDPFTLEVWILPNNLPLSKRGIVSKANPGSARGYALTMFGDEIEFTRYAADGTADSVRAGDVALYEYHHVVATYGGAIRAMCIYLNGEQQQCKSSSKLLQDTAKSFTIGAREDNGVDAIEAVLDEVAVYNLALSADQVSAHCAAGVGG